MLAAGAQIGRYDLVCPLARGESQPDPESWVARQRGTPGFVALRLYATEDAGRRKLLLDEARGFARLEHPNVARLVDFGEAGDRVYLVTEYVDGESLASLLAMATGGVAPATVALRIAADACAAIHAMHELRGGDGAALARFYGDVSLESVVVDLRGTAKVIGGHVTASEHATGRAADVFALGAMLHRMLAGRAPVAGVSEAAALVHRDVGDILACALAADEAARFTTVRALEVALVSALEGLPGGGDARAEVGRWVASHLHPRTVQRRAELERHPAPPPPTPRKPPPPVPKTPRGAPPAIDPEVAFQKTLPATTDVPVKPPGFMNVQALAERPAAPKSDPTRPEVDAAGTKAVARPQEAARPKKPTGGSARSGIEPDRSRRFTTLALVVVALVVVLAGAIFLLPLYVKHRIVSRAREVGIEVTVEHVGVGFGGVTVRGITATTALVSNLEVKAAEVDVASWSGREIRVSGLEVTLDGDPKAVISALASLYEARRKDLAGTSTDPRRVSVISAHATWKNLLGPNSSAEASKITVEHLSKGAGVEISGSLGTFTVTTPRTRFGPWSASVESTRISKRIRLILDPPVPDGPSVLMIGGEGIPPKLSIRIPRTPFAQIGIDPVALGLPADRTTDIAFDLEGNTNPLGRLEGSGTLRLFAAKVPGWKSPVDVRVDVAAAGNPGKPLDLERTVVSVGPFVALVNGTLTPYERGFRLDATFRTQPIACERLARAEARSLGAFAATLEELGRATKLVRVTGSAQASGAAKYDSATPDLGTLTFLTKESCGLSLFGL